MSLFTLHTMDTLLQSHNPIHCIQFGMKSNEISSICTHTHTHTYLPTLPLSPPYLPALISTQHFTSLLHSLFVVICLICVFCVALVSCFFITFESVNRTESNPTQGVNCETNCPSGYYGENCDQVCRCLNNSSCDAETGSCICAPGWTGDDCATPCPEGFYGLECKEPCPDSLHGKQLCCKSLYLYLISLYLCQARQPVIILRVKWFADLAMWVPHVSTPAHRVCTGPTVV